MTLRLLDLVIAHVALFSFVEIVKCSGAGPGSDFGIGNFSVGVRKGSNARYFDLVLVDV